MAKNSKKKTTINKGLVYIPRKASRPNRKGYGFSDYVRCFYIRSNGRLNHLGKNHILSIRDIQEACGVDMNDLDEVKRTEPQVRVALSTVSSEIMDYDKLAYAGAFSYRPLFFGVTRSKETAKRMAINTMPGTHGRVRKQRQLSNTLLDSEEMLQIESAERVMGSVRNAEKGYTKNCRNKAKESYEFQKEFEFDEAKEA